MLIFLDKSLLDIDFNHEPNAIIGLEAILLAYKRGNHYVLGEIQTLKYLEDSGHLSPHHIATIRKIRQSLPTTMSLKKLLEFQVRAVYSADVRSTIQRDSNTWSIPLECFAQISYEATHLICEDLSDADIYTKAGRHYLIKNRLGSIRLRSISIGGGGGSTHSQYKRFVDRSEHFCLCVTDSDFESPNDKSGGITRRRCEAIANSSNWVTHHYAPKVREIENLIPEKILLECLEEEQQDALLRNKQLGEPIKINFLEFGDFKKGIALKKIISYREGDQDLKYWKSAAIESIKRGYAENDCWSERKCTKGECKCSVLFPVSETLSKQVLRYLNDHSDMKSYETAKKSTNIEQWIEVGKVIAEWCCAPTPQYYFA